VQQTAFKKSCGARFARYECKRGNRASFDGTQRGHDREPTLPPECPKDTSN
jgi:hypothetical protein